MPVLSRILQGCSQRK
uniref:Uncharacterized protein n=1 Tax=Anguilla anguilla TaxID=7936 RepID=A0A0E9S6Q2_ANGAN